jgi:hypothetical protein
VRFIVPDLRLGLRLLYHRRSAVRPDPVLLPEPLLFFGDSLLRIRPGLAGRVNYLLNENHSRKPVYHVRSTDCMIRCCIDHIARKQEDRLQMGRPGIRTEVE